MTKAELVAALAKARRLFGPMTPRRIAAACVAATCGLAYLLLIHHTEMAHVGIERNVFTNEISLDTPGWNLTAPWVEVAKIDLRPMRVCVMSSGRAFNCKLVKFEPTAYKQFVATEGFRYYWWSNRFSFNLGYADEYRGFKDILRGYAYSAEKYPFITVIEGY